MRFIATSDWQLGMTAHYLDDRARPRYQQARFDAIGAIGELARREQAGFVVVCGDVFESNQLDRSVLALALEALRGVPVPVVLLPGNHDPLDPVSLYDSPLFTARRPEHVHVLRDSRPLEILPGVEIVGAPWFSKRPDEDLVAQACAELGPTPPGVLRVIAGHGAVSTLNPDQTATDTIQLAGLLEVLESARGQVVVLGDRHSTTRIDPRIWYPGTPEVTHRREEDPGNVLLIDLTPDTVQVTPVHVGTWSFRTVTATLNSAEDVAALAGRLDALPGKERTAVWLALSGTLTPSAMAGLDAVLEQAADLFARLDHWQRHTDLAVLPDGHDFADLGLSGFAQAGLDELSGIATGQGEAAETAQDALSLLFRFSQAGPR